MSLTIEHKRYLMMATPASLQGAIKGVWDVDVRLRGNPADWRYLELGSGYWVEVTQEGCNLWLATLVSQVRVTGCSEDADEARAQDEQNTADLIECALYYQRYPDISATA